MAGRKRDAHRGVVQKRVRELETILTEVEDNEDNKEINVEPPGENGGTEQDDEEVSMMLRQWAKT